ncbi:MAG: MerR family transcriptional regulator [Candidatus Thiodiazotropha sp. (ex Dulcina madagascariensis)]|nr:MerR family transcriptional regulator [Candidatus Thiodiazotropha sp. (ex Dulcina madagascariensis)]
MKLKTITAFAKQFDLSRATLLYYDRIGLLKPAGVSSAGYRLYGEPERVRMARIDTFRKAGLSLAAIQSILDGKNTTALETALEQRLTALNDEITNLGAQQRLVIQLLGREGEYPRCRNINVEQWVAMLEEAGVDEVGRQRWHQAFERDAPDSHQAFLVSLGLKAEEISEIRSRSRDSE